MKAALLASLAYRPDLVILDEPFTGLDPVVRDELIRGLLDVSGDRPATVLIPSHDLDDVERLADWIGFMNEGTTAAGRTGVVPARPLPAGRDCRARGDTAAAATSPRLARAGGVRADASLR